jgi:hypothetical protein
MFPQIKTDQGESDKITGSERRRIQVGCDTSSQQMQHSHAEN